MIAINLDKKSKTELKRLVKKGDLLYAKCDSKSYDFCIVLNEMLECNSNGLFYKVIAADDLENYSFFITSKVPLNPEIEIFLVK